MYLKEIVQSRNFKFGLTSQKPAQKFNITHYYNYKKLFSGQSVQNVGKSYLQTQFYYFRVVVAQDMGFTVHQCVMSMMRTQTHIK
jgi:hypothetical protein